MMHNRKSMSCEEFSASMAGLIAAGEDITAHPHVRRCRLHRALLKDLEAIAQVARQMFPEVEPSDTVWDGIQARLEQQQPRSILSDAWPGCRVLSAIRVRENYHPDDDGPPTPPGSGAKQAAIHLRFRGASHTHARRESDDR